MKSHHFSIIKKGITIVWPWLFKNKYLRELSVITIFPFCLFPSHNTSLLVIDDREGNKTLISIKQQEELLQFSLSFAVLLWFITGSLLSLLMLLFGPLLFIVFYAYKWMKLKEDWKRYPKPLLFSLILMQTAFSKEAYINCNNPKYLYTRNIFRWIRYVYK